MLATLLHRWRWLGAWSLAIGGVLEGRTHHADIAPTLLGCEAAPERYTLGHNLLAPEGGRDWLLSGSYMGYGILLPEYQIAVHPTGAFEAYDYRMNELEAVRPSTEVAAEVLQALSRFYR